MKQVIVTINEPIPLAEFESMYATLRPVVGEDAVVDGRLASALGVRFAIRSADVSPAQVDVLYAAMEQRVAAAKEAVAAAARKRDTCGCGHSAYAHVDNVGCTIGDCACRA